VDVGRRRKVEPCDAAAGARRRARYLAVQGVVRTGEGFAGHDRLRWQHAATARLLKRARRRRVRQDGARWAEVGNIRIVRSQ
jgi:hypothetical protein